MFARQIAMIHCAMLCAALTGCHASSVEKEKEPEKPEPAASSDVKLPKPAQKAIGLAMEKVVSQDVRDTLSTTGWLLARPGREVVVKAPAAGFVVPPAGAERIEVGTTVGADYAIGSLNIFLSPQDQAQMVAAKEEADVAIGQASATLKIAEGRLAALERADGAVSGQRIDELREIVARNKVAEFEAREKLPFLPREPYNESLHLKPIPLKAPLPGRVIALHAAPRQFVVQGDPLWTIADWSSLWVRVPVYVADAPHIRQQQSVTIRVAGEKEPLSAAPVGAPQSTPPGLQTVDLMYEIDNAAGRLRSGQAVSVELPLSKQVPRLVIARSAVLWDGMGNTSVYVHSGPESFRRQRVELGAVQGDRVVAERGLAEGDEVVTVGAQALYGEEFKSHIPGD